MKRDGCCLNLDCRNHLEGEDDWQLMLEVKVCTGTIVLMLLTFLILLLLCILSIVWVIDVKEGISKLIWLRG